MSKKKKLELKYKDSDFQTSNQLYLKNNLIGDKEAINIVSNFQFQYYNYILLDFKYHRFKLKTEYKGIFKRSATNKNVLVEISEKFYNNNEFLFTQLFSNFHKFSTVSDTF